MEEIVKPDGSFDQTVDPINALEKCAKLGLITGIEFYYSKIIDDQSVKYTIMEYAAFFGHRDIIELMITKGANSWNDAIITAARGGQKDMIVFLLSKRRNKRHSRQKNRAALNSAMYQALYKGHIDVANFLITQGANGWKQAMLSAAHDGRIDIVNFMITKGANNWNETMAWAAGYGHIDIVQLMVEKGANNLYHAMSCARHPDIIAYLRQKLQLTLVDYVGSETCSICYVQDTLNMCITKCNHAFHRDCINLWAQEHISCPMCRNNL